MAAPVPKDYWAFFASEAERGHSPLYAHLALGVREDAKLRALAAHARAGQPPANLLLGAVHYLLLDGIDHPLADHFPSVRPNALPAGDAFALFRAFCEAHEARIVPLIEARVTNTNEVARSSTLYPAFDFLSRETGESLHLVEIGPSAGFNLNWDRYRYAYVRDGKPVVERGPVASRLALSTQLGSEAVPPLAAQLPRVASRVGLELNPVDLSRREDRLWLKALIWPELAPRFVRLDGALAEAMTSPPPIRHGDALALLADAVRALPAMGVPVVYHSHVTYQFSAEMRERLNEILTALGRERPVFRVSIEWDGAAYPVAVGLFDRDGRHERHTIAFCDPHGSWLEWVGSETRHP